MPSIDDVYGGNTLKATDIDGRNPIVTISSVVPREFLQKDGAKKNKLVIEFVKATKALVCNKTNGDEIARITGTRDYTKWIGHKIQLVTRMTPMGPGIMVRKPSDQIKTSPQVPIDSFSAEDVEF